MFPCCYIYANKKAGLHYCCSAFQGSSIAFFVQTTTLKPTPYVKFVRYIRTDKLHTNGHLVLHCFGKKFEFARFWNAKTKRVRRLFQYVLYLTHPKDIFPQRGLNTAKLLFCAAKLQLFLHIRKDLG